MKVLHIYRERNEGVIGGVEYHIKYLIKEQLKMGLIPLVLTFKFSNKNSLEVKNREGIQWYFLEIKTPFFFITKKLKVFENGGIGLLIRVNEILAHNLRNKQKINLIYKINPDIIHQHDYLSSVRLSNIIGKKIKIIFTNHYGEFLFLKKTKIGSYFQSIFLKNYDRIIAVSQDMLPINKNAYMIPNGFDSTLFFKLSEEEKNKLKTQHNINDKVVFLCARRWAPTKGIIYLVSALNKLSSEVKEKSVFFFAGNDSDDFEQYKKQVYDVLSKSKGVDYRLCGNLNHIELKQIIDLSDVGIIPSLLEGMSLFSIEMISCGLPVLATNVGGLPEVIKTNKNGWLVPSKDDTSLADEINRIVCNWPNSNLYINTDNFKEKYSWESIAKKTYEIYKL